MKILSVIMIMAAMLASSCNEGTAAEKHPEEQKLVKKVQVIKPLKKQISVRIESGTTLKADEESKITAEVSAPLIKWFVEENSRIQKGDPIAKLDSVNYEIQKNQAAANLKSLESKYISVQKDYERIQRLVEKESFPKQQLDQIESQVDSLKSQIVVATEAVELADRMVQKTTVRAPFSGIVTSKKIALGEFVPAGGKDLITLVKTDVLEAQINVSEMYFGKIDSNSDVTLLLPSIDKKIKGRIKSTGKNIDSSKQFSLIVEIDNRSGSIPAGIYAVAEIVSKKEERLLIPVSAIKETGSNSGEVYTVDAEGKVRKTPVTTALVFEDGTEIRGNVPEFVIKDLSSVSEGEIVEYSF